MGTQSFSLWGSPGKLRNWLASIGEGQLIYELPERRTVYLAYHAAEGSVSEFIGDQLARGPQLSWTELKWPYQTESGKLASRPMCKRKSG